MLAPLKPQVAAQKPEGGLQHPNGDALNVSDTYKAAGGKEIEIYIQDIYPHWPYDNLGMDDYLAKVDSVVRQVMASPNRSLFSYVPFNEPDQIWYNKSDKKQAFFDDWKTVYQKIKSLDPTARIVGPNFARYDSAVYRDFLTFAQDNACLPDVISWHELNSRLFCRLDQPLRRLPEHRKQPGPAGQGDMHQRIWPECGRPGRPGQAGAVDGPVRSQQG